MKKIDRGQIRFRDYWITLLEPKSTGWKTDPAHHDLSERAPPTPAVFKTNIRSISPIKPAHCRLVHFYRAGESGVDRLSGVNGA